MKVTIFKDGKAIDKDFDVKELVEEVIKTMKETPEDCDKELEEDMDFFDKKSHRAYGMYAGLVAVNDFLHTGKEMVEECEDFTDEDFEYGIKVLNACLRRKTKQIGGKYTLVVTPLEKE